MKKFLALIMLVSLTVFASGCLEQKCPEGKCKDKPGPGAASEAKPEAPAAVPAPAPAEAPAEKK